MKIFIIGSGKLANALLTANLATPMDEILKWQPSYKSLNERAILVHAGSGRQLDECFEFCSRTKSVLVELSTGLETERCQPDFPLITCPNTSILVLKTLSMLKTNGKFFENYEMSITESHQSSKMTEPGTAYMFARFLKFPFDKILSIRDSDIQHNKIGIPNEYVDKHAYHKIVIKDGSDEVTIETKVLGHSSYAKGVAFIIDSILKREFENKEYSVLDLLR